MELNQPTTPLPELRPLTSAASITISGKATDPDPQSFWQGLGFTVVTDVDAGLTGTIPPGLVIYTGAPDADPSALTNLIKTLPGPPVPVLARGGTLYLYRAVAGSALGECLPPSGVRRLVGGESVRLPTGDDFRPEQYRCQTMSELPLLDAKPAQQVEPEKASQPTVDTPLTAFSLRGQATRFEDTMVQAVPVLGDLCLAGQSTVWYAAPNAGKTLIALKLLVEAVRQGRINPGNAYYINADDGNEGFATKLRILDDLGVHTLAPGFAGFNAYDLSGLIREMAETNSATGTVIIVDTLKKFADLMHKKEASAFGDATRQYAMHGGTFLGLAHVNKNPAANGKPSYAGVADIVQDADAAYMMTALEDVGDSNERVVQFESFKLRGPGVGKVAYAYAAEAGLSYHERLASVRVVDPKLFEEFERFRAEKSDAHIIAAITRCIEQGVVQKMALAKAASVRAHVPERAAIRTLETYTGDDPAKHRWAYSVRERGAKVFELLSAGRVGNEPGG